MLALVDPPRADPTSDSTRLGRDYGAFERQRTARRQYLKAFGGIAVLVLLGAVFGRVPRDEAVIVAGLLSLAPAWLWIVERLRWRRLARRLDAARDAVHAQKDVSV